MIDQDSTEFSEAFVRALRPDEPRGRPGMWMAVTAAGVVFALALASFLNGALSGGPAPLTSWSAVGGPGCTSAATSFTKVGYYTSTARKSADWTVARSGGYHGAGCSGAFVSVPLSGHAKAYDSSRYALWTFTVSPALGKASTCRLSTYIPGVASRSAVGAAPAHYYYYASAYVPGSAKPSGQYSVNQVKERGKWVPNLSSFIVTSGKVSVRLIDAGTGQGARAAAAQVRLTCAARS
jgi:hypothetical protein